MKYKLTPEEKEIERTADELTIVGKDKKQRVQKILDKARKGHAISLRLASQDLEMIKKRAQEEGLPYQTLINTILHKFVTDQLYDKKELRKVISGILEVNAM